MDAKITKQRLSNFLSYDWLKILLAAVLAVVAICVFFTTVRTMPSDRQVFTVYAYELSEGDDAYSFSDDLLENDIFSYEILQTQYESLTQSATGSLFGGLYSGATYATRLVNSARTVMFVNGLDDASSAGYDAVKSLVGVNSHLTGNERNGYLDFEEYLSDCKAYLTVFFGDDFENGTLDEEAAENCFSARNNGDKRFRSEEQKETGLLQEKARLERLREDYLAVTEAFGREKLSYSSFTIDEDAATEDQPVGEYICGVSLGKLNTLRNLFYYETEDAESGETEKTVSGIAMIIFNSTDLSDKTNDLRYETISFLSYLLKTYGG